MGKHKGDPDRHFEPAVEKAAEKALREAGPGNYTIATIEVTVHRAEAGEAPGNNPMSDYRITLDGPS
jgi:hypothetical protein